MIKNQFFSQHNFRLMLNVFILFFVLISGLGITVFLQILGMSPYVYLNLLVLYFIVYLESERFFDIYRGNNKDSYCKLSKTESDWLDVITYLHSGFSPGRTGESFFESGSGKFSLVFLYIFRPRPPFRGNASNTLRLALTTISTKGAQALVRSTAFILLYEKNVIGIVILIIDIAFSIFYELMLKKKSKFLF